MSMFTKQVQVTSRIIFDGEERRRTYTITQQRPVFVGLMCGIGGLIFNWSMYSGLTLGGVAGSAIAILIFSLLTWMKNKKQVEREETLRYA